MVSTCNNPVTHSREVDVVLNLFQQHEKSLSFTHELPNDKSLQSLDILTLGEGHMCWKFSPTMRKELLSYDPATMCFHSVLTNSCSTQWTRLTALRLHGLLHSLHWVITALSDPGVIHWVITAYCIQTSLFSLSQCVRNIAPESERRTQKARAIARIEKKTTCCATHAQNLSQPKRDYKSAPCACGLLCPK